MFMDVYNVSSHSLTQGSYKLIFGELNLPLVIKEVQVTEVTEFQVFTSSLAGATAALQVLRTISIPLFTDVLRQLNNLRDVIFVFLQTIYLILADNVGVISKCGEARGKFGNVCSLRCLEILSRI